MESMQTFGFGFDSSLSRRVSSFVDLTSSGWLLGLFRNRNAMFAREMRGEERRREGVFSSGETAWNEARV